MKFTKRLFLPMLFAMMALSWLNSCKDDNPGLDDPIEEEDYIYNGGDHGVTYNYGAYLASTIDGELRSSLEKCLPYRNITIDQLTNLIIVKDLTDIQATELEQAFQRGCTVAVVDPQHASLQSWFDSHPDWNVHYSEDTLGDDAIIYYFNKNHNQGVVKRTPLSVDMNSFDDFDDEDPGDNELDFSGDGSNGQYYAVVGLWLDHMNQLNEEPPFSITDNETDKQLPRIEELTSSYRFHNYFPIQLNKVIRRGIGINGNGGISITMEVNPIHVYEKKDQNAEAVANGDYYLVSMSASIANSNMYIGKFTKFKALVWYRLIGYICDNFSVRASLQQNNGSNVPNLVIPINSGPFPQTTVGQTSYQSSQKFSLGVSGGWSVEDGPKAGVEFGAEWSSSQERSIKDIGIKNTTDNNAPSWTVKFENLPKYSDGKIAFVEQKGVYSFRATQYLFAQWVWQVQGTRDNEELPKKIIVVDGDATYKAMSFFSTRADLKTHTFIIPYSCKFEVPDPYKRTKGHIVLHNDTGGYISDVKVLDPETGTILCSLPDSYPAGKEIDLGWYPVYKAQSNSEEAHYVISFTMNGDTYVLKNEWIIMEDRATRNLYVTDNFRKF